MIKVRPLKTPYGCHKLAAYDGRAKVGMIGVCERGPRLHVVGADVLPTHQRRGVGTKLYEAAAQIACKEGLVLSSRGFQRSPMSEGFWQKQLAKGRARVYDRNDAKPDVELIDACKVTTLAGPRRRRR